MSNKDDLISAGYLNTIRAMHKSRPWGESSKREGPAVLSFAEAINARSCLDYGCGRGRLKPLVAESFDKYDEYDPGIPGKDDLPAGQYDLVVCTDVMEHVEQDKVENVLVNIFNLTKPGGGVYFKICLVPCGKNLPDGRNCHITLLGQEEWRAIIGSVFLSAEYKVIKGGDSLPKHLVAWCRRVG